MIDRLHEIRFDPDGKGYAQIVTPEVNPYVLEEVEVLGVVMTEEIDKALLIREVEIEGRIERILHPVKVAGEQAVEWLSSKIPLMHEIQPSVVSSPDIGAELSLAEERLRKVSRETGRPLVINIRSYGSPRLLDRD